MSNEPLASPRRAHSAILFADVHGYAQLMDRNEERTYQRWKIVFRASALTSAAYVLSVNRPDPEAGVLIGGPSVAIDPSGTPLVETTDRMALLTLEREEVGRARVAYPGYLPIRADLYGAAWDEIATRRG